MTTLRDFTPATKKSLQITNVKRDGDFYVIDYNHLDFEANTAEPTNCIVTNNGGAKLSLLIHLRELHAI